MSTDHDTYLPGAVQALDDAIHALTRVQTTRLEDGRVFTAPNLYVQMRQAVAGQQNGADSKTMFRSTPSAWTSGLDWVVEVDRSVKEWAHPKLGHTLSLLAGLPVGRFRPQDVPVLQDWARIVLGWVSSAEELLSGGCRMEVKAPCPACGERFVWRRDGLGESVKQAALMVTTTSCRCQACGTVWPPSHFEFLAATLGCERIA